MAITRLDELVANISLIEVPAEHGAGAVGTSDFGAPRTYRATIDGVIITQIKIDLSGLYDGGTNGDVIGLATATKCYIGKNVVATNGLIFKTELSCIELPATGNTDIDIVENTNELEGDAAGGGVQVSADTGGIAAGITYQNLAPAHTADDFYYLSAASRSGATYSAGQIIFTTWGHPALT